MTRYVDPDIARVYHEHSKLVRGSSGRRHDDPDLADAPPPFRIHPGDERYALPGRDFELDASLGQLLRDRKSTRLFEPTAIESQVAGRLLHASFGVRAYHETGGEAVAERPFPSAGGQYPLEVYVATRSVTDIPDGLYHYSVREHELVALHRDLTHSQLADVAIHRETVEAANIVVIITAVFDRTMWRYEQRGYRHILLEAGHLGQNFCLCAAALGLGVVPIGGFYDHELNGLLGLEPDETALYMICCGAPKASREVHRAEPTETVRDR